MQNRTIDIFCTLSTVNLPGSVLDGVFLVVEGNYSILPYSRIDCQHGTHNVRMGGLVSANQIDLVLQLLGEQNYICTFFHSYVILPVRPYEPYISRFGEYQTQRTIGGYFTEC